MYTEIDMGEQGESQTHTKPVEEEIRRLGVLPDIESVIQFEPNQTQYVHATGQRETADTIVRKGILCNRGGLGGVAVKIPDKKEYRLSVLAGRHMGHRYIVVITLPALPPELKQKMNKANADWALEITTDALLARPLEDSKKNQYGRRHESYLAAKFIKGFFDTVTGKFTPNPNFEPQLNSEDYNEINGRLDNLSEDSYHDYH